MALQLDIVLDPRSEVPLYRQIARWVTEAAETGRLSPGERLPPVRELAVSLSVARVTVHHAYALLREGGVVESTVGRGTFISGSSKPARTSAGGRGTSEDPFSWQDELRRPGVDADLARAEPAPDLTPAADFLRLHRELSDDTDVLTSYGAVEGEWRLRSEVARRLTESGIECRAEEVMITPGSTLALAALVQQLARPGERVLVEQTTYFGLLSLLDSFGVEPVPVPMDEQGIDPGALERALLRDRPRFLYTMPTFHNPTGVSMTDHRRLEVLALAQHYDLTIVEDDPFHDLSYDEPAPRPLKAMASGADVVYVGSFSKCLLPGLRVGFVVPSHSLRRGLASRLETLALTSPRLLQRTLAEYLRRGELDRHLERIVPVYRQRRDAMMGALQEHMPPGVEWLRPAGGLCCWLSLPDGDFDDLAREAARRGVGYVPGWAFDPLRRRVPGLRLCMVSSTMDRVDSQVQVLGKLIRERLPARNAEREAPAESIPIV